MIKATFPATGLSLLAEAAKVRQKDTSVIAVTRHSGCSMTCTASASTKPMISDISTSMTMLVTRLAARSGFITKNAT